MKVKRGLLMKDTVVEESPKGLEKEREFVMKEVVVLKGVMTVCWGCGVSNCGGCRSRLVGV